MAQVFEILREEHVAPPGLSAQTLLLAPGDIYGLIRPGCISWPMFFNYDIDASRLEATLVETRATLSKYIAIEMGSPETPAAAAAAELKSDMCLATAILEHSQIRGDSADFPVYPDVPFFMESLDTKALHRGEVPLVKVRLTHFSDGCALNVTCSHMLADGQRYVELCRDLGRAYRGEEILDRDNDRTRLWPDQLAKHYPFLGEEVASLSRTATETEDEPDIMRYPEDRSYGETFYFSKDVLEKMKGIVKPFLSEDQFVSFNDILVSFLWLLKGEISKDRTAPVATGADLELANTFASYTIEYVKNGVDVVPENFFGNALGFHLLTTQGLELEDKSLEEVLAQLALLSRNSLITFRSQPQVAAQNIMLYYSIVHSGKYPVSFKGFRVAFTNLVKTPILEIDFGKGAPKMMNVVALPITGISGSAGPGFGNGEGIILNLQLLGSQESKLENSEVMKKCAPGVKLLYSGITQAELQALLDS